MAEQLEHGILITTSLKGLSESKSRLFRKKRVQLHKRTKLLFHKKVKGVYFYPFEKPIPSQEEIREFEIFVQLIREFNVTAIFFAGTFVNPFTSAEGSKKHGILGVDLPSKLYFVLDPIKVLRGDESFD